MSKQTKKLEFEIKSFLPILILY